jgi:bacteriophage N4 adsorption protein B
MDTTQHIFLVLGYVAGIGFLLSGLDDLIFDTQFLFYLWRQRNKPHITLQELNLEHEQWIALFVPAWQEGGVVNKMAEYAANIIAYEKYDIFIGVYPNDPETIHCVDEICAVNPRIHKVMVPHPGPTSKADCLNAIYREMRLNEIPGVREYAIVVLHDSEDIIHPLAVKVYNYFVPRVYDMAQLPVFALELPVLKYWTGNCYIDDFAELHTKDMFVRESIGGVVPSAGIGTAFSMNLLRKLAADNDGDPFRVGNLTEDYEIGIRAKRAGFRVGVVSYPVDRVVRKPNPDGSLGEARVVTEVVAIRDPFPTHFGAAVRQRSRWILGISFQTWEQAGWAGTWPMRYTLLRDRRAPLTHLINMIGYLVVAYIFFQGCFRYTRWAANVYVPPLLETDSFLLKIAIIDTCLLVYRMVQKIISVAAIYNMKQAVFSVPRLMISNFINFFATVSAARMYFANKFFGTPVVWLKTAHVFPGAAQLSEYERTIEDLLVAEGLVTRQQIMAALEKEKNSSVPLALLRLGLLDEKQFTDVWAKYSKLEIRRVDPAAVSQPLLGGFKEAQSISLNALPLEEKDGTVTLALREPPAAGQMDNLKRNFNGKPVRAVLARPTNLNFARTRLYPRLVLPPSNLDGTIRQFQDASKLAAPEFLDVLINQFAVRRSLPDVLVDRSLVDEAAARRLWAETLGCPPWETKEFTLDREAYRKFGPSYWWLHRMLPAGNNKVIAAAPPHPQTVAWLNAKLAGTTTVLAELPDKLELAARVSSIVIDPDQLLINQLIADGALNKNAAPDVRELRTLIADPIPKWMLVQKIVSEEQLHKAFLQIANLPVAEPWEEAEARRLLPILPPGFIANHGCHPLQEKGGAIRLGLTQLPSPQMLAELYDRLGGYALCFQALNLADAAKLRALAAQP